MSAVDNFAAEGTGLNSPAYTLVSVTPSDTNDLSYTTRALHVSGTGGFVSVTTAGMATGNSVQVYIAQGGLFPVRVSRVWNTGTSASGIVAVY